MLSKLLRIVLFAAVFFTTCSLDTPVGESVSVRWEEKYMIQFNTNGGMACEPKIVDIGATIILPSTSRNGYTFEGWFSAISGGTKVGGAGNYYTVNGNITLYAQWRLVNNTHDERLLGTWYQIGFHQTGYTFRANGTYTSFMTGHVVGTNLQWRTDRANGMLCLGEPGIQYTYSISINDSQLIIENRIAHRVYRR